VELAPTSLFQPPSNRRLLLRHRLLRHLLLRHLLLRHLLRTWLARARVPHPLPSLHRWIRLRTRLPQPLLQLPQHRLLVRPR
jgi:hypothetical protein